MEFYQLVVHSDSQPNNLAYHDVLKQHHSNEW